MTFLQHFLRRMLEPARDPLSDSLSLSLGRVTELRAALQKQILGLRSRVGRSLDPAFEAQLQRLETEYSQLAAVEHRVTGELDAQKARCELLNARQTAAQAQDRLDDLIGALDEAHAHAAALAESVSGS